MKVYDILKWYPCTFNCHETVFEIGRWSGARGQ